MPKVSVRHERRPLPLQHRVSLSRSGVIWRGVALVVAGALTFSNSLSGPFVLDDQLSIVYNSHIRHLWPPASALVAEPDSPTAGRPLVNLSFALNYALGDLDVRGYHAWNIAVHILCSLLVFGVVRRTMALPLLPRLFNENNVNLGFAVSL